MASRASVVAGWRASADRIGLGSVLHRAAQRAAYNRRMQVASQARRAAIRADYDAAIARGERLRIAYLADRYGVTQRQVLYDLAITAPGCELTTYDDLRAARRAARGL